MERQCTIGTLSTYSFLYWEHPLGSERPLTTLTTTANYANYAAVVCVVRVVRGVPKSVPAHRSQVFPTVLTVPTNNTNYAKSQNYSGNAGNC